MKTYLVRFCSAEEVNRGQTQLGFDMTKFPQKTFTHFMAGYLLEHVRMEGQSSGLGRQHVIELDHSMLVEATPEAVNAIKKMNGIRNIEEEKPNGPSAFIPPVRSKKVPGPGRN